MRRMWMLALAGCSSHARVEPVPDDVRVTVTSPGHSAEDLDASVAVPLVHALSWAHTRSSAREGRVTIDIASNDTARIESSIQAAAKELPTDATLPIIDKRAGAHLVRRYVMRSATDPVATVAAKHAAWRLAVLQLPGVRRVDACGARPAIHEVAIDERRMVAVGLTLHPIRMAIETTRPTMDALLDVALATPAGPTVHLRDIATLTVQPSDDGCLALDSRSGLIVGEVWASSAVQLPAAPPGLELRELDLKTVELSVDWNAGNRADAVEALERSVGRALERTHTDAIVEVGDEIRILVPNADVTAALDALRGVPGIVVHAPPSLVVGVVGADRTQLAGAATSIENALGTRADGTIGTAHQYAGERKVDEALARKNGIDVQEARDTLAATWNGGIALSLDAPVRLVLISDGARMQDAITETSGPAPIEVRRSDGVPWLGVRASGTPDEIAQLVKAVKLPSGVRWRLER